MCIRGEPLQLAFERRGMAGGEHDSGRVYRARHHSEAETGGRRGNCGIPAEQDRTVIRILESKDAGRLLTRKAAGMAEAEAVVAPILAAVRKRGDAALMEYARKFDGLARRSVQIGRASCRERG